jgi:mono/diheme cytochrome c family protein
LAQQDDVRAGQADYDRVCKVCHGADAKGDAGPKLVPFTREYDELLAIVREGTGQMPPISARELPDEDVGRIGAYLRALSRQLATAGFLQTNSS